MIIILICRYAKEWFPWAKYHFVAMENKELKAIVVLLLLLVIILFQHYKVNLD